MLWYKSPSGGLITAPNTHPCPNIVKWLPVNDNLGLGQCCGVVAKPPCKDDILHGYLFNSQMFHFQSSSLLNLEKEQNMDKYLGPAKHMSYMDENSAVALTWPSSVITALWGVNQ